MLSKKALLYNCHNKHNTCLTKFNFNSIFQMKKITTKMMMKIVTGKAILILITLSRTMMAIAMKELYSVITILDVAMMTEEVPNLSWMKNKYIGNTSKDARKPNIRYKKMTMSTFYETYYLELIFIDIFTITLSFLFEMIEQLSYNLIIYHICLNYP